MVKTASSIGGFRGGRSLHVLYVNSHLSRTDSEAATWGRKFVRELRNAGVEVSTIPAYSESDGKDTRAKPHFLRVQVLKKYLPAWLVHSLIEPRMVLRGLMDTVLLWSQVRRLRACVPDVVYARVGYWDWAPWLIGRSLRRPVILEVHGLNYIERTFRGRRKSRLLRTFELAQLRRVSYVRVSSKPVIELLEQDGIDRDQVRHIPLGVEVLARPERELSSAESSVKIVFVGSFYPWHGAEVLVHALALVRKKLPDARLELIGDGLTRADNEKLAKELGIENAVDFVGWLPREVMLRRVQESDIAIAPFLTLYYFDPAKIFDYMSTGVAIIASHLERTAEILQGGRGGVLVPPGDAEALAAEIVSLSHDPARRTSLGMSAQEILAEEGYRHDAVVERLLSLFSESVSAGSGHLEK